MPTHAVAGDTNARGVELGEGGEERGGQLGGDVGFHLVVGGVGGFGGVEVETGAAAEIVGLVFALDFESACSPFISSYTS